VRGKAPAPLKAVGPGEVGGQQRAGGPWTPRRELRGRRFTARAQEPPKLCANSQKFSIRTTDAYLSQEKGKLEKKKLRLKLLFLKTQKRRSAVFKKKISIF